MTRFCRYVLLLGIALLAGCATTAPSIDAVDDDRAQELVGQGDFRAAALEYERLAANNRSVRDQLLLNAADSLREEGDMTGIARVVDKVRRSRLNAEDAARLDLLLAEIALSGAAPEDALSLATLPNAQLPPALVARAGEIRARALDLLARPFDAASERINLLSQVPEAERAAVENDIIEALARIEAGTLNNTLGGFDASDARRPWLERALRLKGVMPSRIMPRPTRQAGTLVQLRGEDGRWRQEGYQSTPQIALLLPSTGAMAQAAAAIRDGFLAAYYADEGAHRSGGSDVRSADSADGIQAKPKLRIYDAGETPASARAAYERAVTDGATRAVGPLARDLVAAVLAVADPRVPVLALNHPDNAVAPPLGSQLFGLLPDDEAALAAEYAFARGLRRVAVLAAAEEWSERAALAFRAQFEQLGGEIAGEARLALDVVDYSMAIIQATSTGPDSAFIAVRPQQGRLLVPQIRARGMELLPLIATSHVFSGSNSRALDRDLNEVEFCDAPWLFGASSGMPAREALSRHLGSATNAPRLFAFGIDAYRLLPYLDWLGNNPDAYLPGASGLLTVDQFGRVRRLLTWMRIVDGVPRAVDGLQSADQLPAPGAPAP